MRKARKEEGGSWMDTYGDMVTLLLCLFVMLYAISAVDQGKFEILVKSLNPSAMVVDPAGGIDAEATGEYLQLTNTPDDFETLYENLKSEVEKNELSESIDVKKGDGFTFITFNNSIVFDPNSYILKDEIKTVLDDLCNILASYEGDIQQIQILGHTAEANKGEMNISADRFLSSNRAAAVLVYMQEKNVIEPVKLISIGYGQYRPIADNSTPEGRATNRRVELLITKGDAEIKSLDEYYKEVYE